MGWWPAGWTGRVISLSALFSWVCGSVWTEGEQLHVNAACGVSGSYRVVFLLCESCSVQMRLTGRCMRRVVLIMWPYPACAHTNTHTHWSVATLHLCKMLIAYKAAPFKTPPPSLSHSFSLELSLCLFSLSSISSSAVALSTVLQDSVTCPLTFSWTAELSLNFLICPLTL